MKARNVFLGLLLALVFPSSLALAYSGEVAFSAEEVERHRSGLPVLMKTASECLQEDLDTHHKFFDKWKISPFFGDRSVFNRRQNPDGTFRTTTLEERRQYLRSFTVKMGGYSTRRFNEEQIDYYLKITKPTSCVGLVLKCLGRGFEAADQADIWKRIREFTMANYVSGGALQEGLQNLGWTLYYWNPDVTQNAKWDAEEMKRTPDNKDKIWGKHVWNWDMVRSRGRYLYNRVDNISAMVNFGHQVPPIVKSVPFFVGVAHMGYHVFPGSYGQIIEGHSTRQLNDRQTLETSPFNPLSVGGGPRGFYNSGLIAIPPGYANPAFDSPGFKAPRVPSLPQKKKSPSIFDRWF